MLNGTLAFKNDLKFSYQVSWRKAIYSFWSELFACIVFHHWLTELLACIYGIYAKQRCIYLICFWGCLLRPTLPNFDHLDDDSDMGLKLEMLQILTVVLIGKVAFFDSCNTKSPCCFLSRICKKRRWRPRCFFPQLGIVQDFSFSLENDRSSILH